MGLIGGWPGCGRANAVGTPGRRPPLDTAKLLSQIDGLLKAHFLPLADGTLKALRADAAGQTFEPVDIEAGMRPLLRALAALLVETLATQVDGGRVNNRHVCPCGKHYRFVRKQKRWFGFLFGQVQPARAMYRCRDCCRTRIPLEQVWGLQRGPYAVGRRYLAPHAQQALAKLCAALPYREACRHFCELTGLEVSVMQAWRLVQHLGEQLQEEVKREGRLLEQARVANAAVRRWFIGADGVMVAFWKGGKQQRRRTKRGERARKNGIVWREVKVGVIAQLNARGGVIRGSQVYLVALLPAARFRIRLSRMARQCGVRPGEVVALVTDGAKWLRALWSRHFPDAVAIRDFYHAVEHLGAMAVALYGEGHQFVSRWQRQMASRLKRGELPALLAEWEQPRRKPKEWHTWQREIHYFRSQQEAMAYDKFREAKLPIGSGVVESGCKNTVGTRFKRPGARWSAQGFHNLAPLRARYCSGEPLMP